MENNFFIFPVSDAAVTIDLGSSINENLNRKAIAIHHWLIKHPIRGTKDIIIGYSSVTIFYDPVIILNFFPAFPTAFDFIQAKLIEAFENSSLTEELQGDIIRIPVCYDRDLGFDLEFVSTEKQLPVEEIIRIHQESVYRVYMIGFLPGFSYMGEIDPRITIPRKPRPVPVLPGSLGIAGSQTGVYPLNCPGGWQIIGRTPVKLFNKNEQPPVKLSIGDRVNFYGIGREEFEEQSRSQN